MTRDEARGISGQSALTERERREEAEIRSVVLAQPHRRGDDSREAESALGRLCRASKWHPTCYDAGVLYGDNIRRLRLAEGWRVPSITPSLFGGPITPEQRELYRSKVRQADYELRSIKLRLPSIMVSLCYDDREQDAASFGIIGGGLVKLTLHYGLRKFFHEPA